MSDNKNRPLDDKTRIFNLSDNEEKDFFADSPLEDINGFSEKPVKNTQKPAISYDDGFNEVVDEKTREVNLKNHSDTKPIYKTDSQYIHNNNNNRTNKDNDNKNDKKSKTPLVVGIVAGVLMIIAIVVTIVICAKGCSDENNNKVVTTTESTTAEETTTIFNGFDNTEDENTIEYPTQEEFTEATEPETQTTVTESETEETTVTEATEPTEKETEETEQTAVSKDYVAANFSAYKCITPDGNVISDNIENDLGGNVSISLGEDGSFLMEVGSIAGEVGSYVINGNSISLEGYTGNISFDDAGNPIGIVVNVDGYTVYFN